MNDNLGRILQSVSLPLFRNILTLPLRKVEAHEEPQSGLMASIKIRTR